MLGSKSTAFNHQFTDPVWSTRNFPLVCKIFSYSHDVFTIINLFQCDLDYFTDQQKISGEPDSAHEPAVKNQWPKSPTFKNVHSSIQWIVTMTQD